MKSNRIAFIAGVFVFFSILLTLTWLLTSKKTEFPKEISIELILSKIENREVNEARFKRSKVEITDNNYEKFFSKLGSDPTREALISEINEFNKINPKNPIKYSEESESMGWGWIVLANNLPFYLLFVATLIVIVYAVRTLSRNKS